MFKTLHLFNFRFQAGFDLHALVEAAQANKFVPCGPSQVTSTGFVQVRNEEGAPLVEMLDGQVLFKVCTEEKIIPTSAVVKLVKERCDKILSETGRKPGRRETKEIKEDARNSLLPTALAKTSVHWVWLEPAKSRMAINTSSSSKSDELVTLMVKTFDGFSATHIQTEMSVSHAITQWLLNASNTDTPGDFSVGKECRLQNPGHGNASAVFKNHDLFNELVRTHIQHGKVVTECSLEWRDAMQFTIDGNMQIKKIKVIGVSDMASEAEETAADSFAGTVAIYTGVTSKMLDDLVHCLGGQPSDF